MKNSHSALKADELLIRQLSRRVTKYMWRPEKKNDCMDVYPSDMDEMTIAEIIKCYNIFLFIVRNS
jgi:hypothetical protein